jgi:hypothetical protein
VFDLVVHTARQLVGEHPVPRFQGRKKGCNVHPKRHLIQHRRIATNQTVEIDGLELNFAPISVIHDVLCFRLVLGNLLALRFSDSVP